MTHVEKVRRFMELAGQELPTKPCVPDEKTRLLRAKLILEEALETIQALGIEPYTSSGGGMHASEIPLTEYYLGFKFKGEPNLVEIADGCADIMVVTTGTALACGINPEPIQELVDNANLDKFQSPVCPECGGILEPDENNSPEEYWCCSNCRYMPTFSKEEVGGYTRKDGKWIKPHNWKDPDILNELVEQSKDLHPNTIKQLEDE